MVTEPMVYAVMLTRARRPALARRAVECFRSQTYSAKKLLIVNSGSLPLIQGSYERDIIEPCYVGVDAHTVGELRNRGALTAAQLFAEILIHWDDDDWSHPERIAEQVALLQSSGADCVGYREMMFWREASACSDDKVNLSDIKLAGTARHTGQAWLYSNPDPRYCLGTSLCYWRKTWERKRFEATSQGEDVRFTTWLNCIGVSSVNALPRMIARIHSGNTSNAYDRAKMIKAKEWCRVPDWDSYARSVME